MWFGSVLGQHLWQFSKLAWKHKNVNATYLLFILEGIKIAWVKVGPCPVQWRSVDGTVNHCTTVIPMNLEYQLDEKTTMGVQWKMGHRGILYILHWEYLQCRVEQRTLNHIFSTPSIVGPPFGSEFQANLLL